jgi:hypothetical protein
MGQMTARACRGCGRVLRKWVNDLGSVSYWCDVCDGYNSEAGKWVVKSHPPWRKGRPPR